MTTTTTTTQMDFVREIIGTVTTSEDHVLDIDHVPVDATVEDLKIMQKIDLFHNACNWAFPCPNTDRGAWTEHIDAHQHLVVLLDHLFDTEIDALAKCDTDLVASFGRGQAATAEVIGAPLRLYVSLCSKIAKLCRMQIASTYDVFSTSPDEMNEIPLQPDSTGIYHQMIYIKQARRSARKYADYMLAFHMIYMLLCGIDKADRSAEQTRVHDLLKLVLGPYDLVAAMYARSVLLVLTPGVTNDNRVAHITQSCLLGEGKVSAPLTVTNDFADSFMDAVDIVIAVLCNRTVLIDNSMRHMLPDYCEFNEENKITIDILCVSPFNICDHHNPPLFPEIANAFNCNKLDVATIGAVVSNMANMASSMDSEIDVRHNICGTLPFTDDKSKIDAVMGGMSIAQSLRLLASPWVLTRIRLFRSVLHMIKCVAVVGNRHIVKPVMQRLGCQQNNHASTVSNIISCRIMCHQSRYHCSTPSTLTKFMQLGIYDEMFVDSFRLCTAIPVASVINDMFVVNVVSNHHLEYLASPSASVRLIVCIDNIIEPALFRALVYRMYGDAAGPHSDVLEMLVGQGPAERERKYARHLEQLAPMYCATTME